MEIVKFNCIDYRKGQISSISAFGGEWQCEGTWDWIIKDNLNWLLNLIYKTENKIFIRVWT